MLTRKMNAGGSRATGMQRTGVPGTTVADKIIMAQAFLQCLSGRKARCGVLPSFVELNMRTSMHHSDCFGQGVRHATKYLALAL